MALKMPVVLIASLIVPARAHAQTGSLADALILFPTGNPAVHAVAAMLPSQTATFPLATSSGGFSWIFDRSVGIQTRRSLSFGPIFAERPLVVGRRRGNIGVTFQRTTFDSVAGQPLSQLTQVVSSQGVLFQTDTSLRITTTRTIVTGSYGITDDLEVGIVVPFVSTTGDADYVFFAVGSQPNFKVTPVSQTAAEIGDVLLRAKVVMPSVDMLGLAGAVDVRLPIGNKRDLTGTGHTQVRMMLMGSSPLGPVSPHFNFAYTFGGSGLVFESYPDPLIQGQTSHRLSIASLFDPEPSPEIGYTFGADAAVSARVTVFGDVIGRALRSSAQFELLRAAPAGSPLRDQVFLGFMARANVDPLWLPVSNRVGRLFRRRPRRFGAGLDYGLRRESALRRVMGRLRGWAVFHPDRTRFVEAILIGALVLFLRTPSRPVISTSAPPTGAVPTAALAPPVAEPLGSRPLDAGPQMPPVSAAPVPSAATTAGAALPASTGRGVSPQGSRAPAPAVSGSRPISNASPPTLDTPPQQQPEPAVVQTTPPTQPPATQLTPPQSPAVPDSRPDSQPAVQTGPPDPNPAGSQTGSNQTAPGSSSLTTSAPQTDDGLIRQLMQNYATALERLDVNAVAAVYPSVNTRTLQTAFNDYRSLQQIIEISRIEVAPNGQTATVMATVTTAPVVRTGRTSRQTRTVTYTVRKEGTRWVIENAR